MPMKMINIHQAKTHLSQLVEDVVNGEPFIIAKAGKPMVKVVPIDDAKMTAKRIGFMEGQFTLPENFEEIDRELDREIEKLFLGEGNE